jgi:hypothetical protein
MEKHTVEYMREVFDENPVLVASTLAGIVIGCVLALAS